MKKFIFVFLIFFLIAIALIIEFMFFTNIVVKENSNIIIEKGDSLSTVITKLDQNLYIYHPLILKLIIQIMRLDKKIKAGEYQFQPNINMYAVINKIVSGDTLTRYITINSGMTKYQILQKLLQEPALDGTLSDDISEGKIFPDTYYFKYGEKRSTLLKNMQLLFHQKFTEIWEQKYLQSQLKSIEEVIILASIVEKEAKDFQDMRRVAGVFLNRIKHGMKLQSDPTVVYAISNGTGILNRILTTEDTKINSKFNTYYIYGLPPTPISNPSLNAFIAVLEPLITNELYFISDNRGNIYFSTNLNDHNKYKRMLKSVSNTPLSIDRQS